ncbi:MAG: HAD family hydrolase, partial [Actinobacteria bacterium]
MPAFSKIRTVLCDLDGVVWLAHHPIAGSVEAVERMRASGRRVLFVTNNSAATVAGHAAALELVGIRAVGDVVSSSMAAARLVEAGERVLVTGGPGVEEAIEQRGATAIRNSGGAVKPPIDAVVVGLHRDFDYQILASAAAAVRAGARLIGTNGDTTFPPPEGLEPGGGAILAAVEAASGVVAEVAGKPHRPMAALIGETLSSASRPFDPTGVLMVGDRPETDGLFAAEIQ